MPVPDGVAISSAPNTTGFHQSQVARLRAAEEALRDSVTREAGLRGQITVLLQQLEQAQARTHDTIRSGGEEGGSSGGGGVIVGGTSSSALPTYPVLPASHVVAPLPSAPYVPPASVTAATATQSVAPQPLLAHPAQASPAIAKAMAPYTEEITVKFPELESCLLDEETGKSTCVSPDIQFRTSWMVHLVPQDNPGKGWRFHHLIAQGLAKHPYVNLTSDMNVADAIIWLPTSTGQPPKSLPPKAKFLILDEGDGAGYVPKAQSINYIAYFKRSWTKKQNGKVRAWNENVKWCWLTRSRCSTTSCIAHPSRPIDLCICVVPWRTKAPQPELLPDDLFGLGRVP